MATDDVTQSTMPCLCGKGTIRVTTTSPDHPWVREHQVSRSYEVLCESCAEKYSVDDDRIVERAAKAKAEAVKQQIRDAETELEATSAFAEVKNRVVAELKEQATVVAKYRFLSSIGLTHHSLGTFRKHWSSVEDWQKQSRIYAFHMPAIVTGLRIGDPTVLAAVAKIQELKKSIPPVATVKKLH
jgi:hypothetical protein